MTPVESLKSRARGMSLGVYAADLGALGSAAQQAQSWGCKILHFDVMDGVFLRPMTAGPGFVKALDTGLLRDVHLMVQDPAAQVGGYVDAGADLITVHAEATGAGDAVANIRARAQKAGRTVLAGLALMPGTPLDSVTALLKETSPDLILVLSLDPRDGTGPDIAAACARVQDLRTRYGTAGPLLAFDGGVTFDSIKQIAACRPDIVVSGSAVFKAADPAGAFHKMSTALSSPAPAGHLNLT